jgi:uncharacterized protein (DUF1015 family)
MCEIRAFPAIRYDTRSGADLSTRLAPPYDVLDAEDKRSLLARDARNFVAIDLPHVPPKDAGPADLYRQARQTLEAWLADGTLVRDERPALYVYHQRYEHAGRSYLRKMFFARMRLEPLGQGSVFAHEQTFGGPKEDRLCLMRETRAHLSPIFLLYPDERNAVSTRLDAALAPEPLAAGHLDGVESRLWAVTDGITISQVCDLMRPRPAYIADGHHRYGTALLYQEELVRARGAVPSDDPANFVLVVMCAMEDEGLLILPTHRVLPGFAPRPGRFRDDPALEIAHLPVDSADQVPSALEKFGPQAVGLFTSAEPGFFMIRPRQAGILDPIAPDRSPAWRRLGLAFLHAYLIERFAPPAPANAAPEKPSAVTSPTAAGKPVIHYVKSAPAAVDEARQGGCVFLLQPTTMAELAAVCQAGDLMPQKSTFFYPKLASGLVVNPLT